jgi:hypothetical protein
MEVVPVEKIVIDAAVVAFAAPAYIQATASTLEVRERSVTLGSASGPVCPKMGWLVVRPLTLSDQRTSLRADATGITSTDTGATALGMRNFRSFKPRTGSYAISGTG